MASATMQAMRAAARRMYVSLLPLETRERLWMYRHKHYWNEWQAPPISPQYLIERERSVRRLQQLMARQAEYKGVVVFPPSVLWDIPLFQRPQQMARAFAQLGYLVIYWEGTQVARRKYQIREVSQNIYAVRMPAQALATISKPLAISYTYNYNWVKRLTDPTVVYEFIDHLDIFTNFPRPSLEDHHAQLLKCARLVVATADDLLEAVKPDRPDAILAPNAADYALFGAASADTAIPQDMQALVAEGKPIIGYYGALAEWFDYDLIHALAQTMADCAFVLIGPPYDDSVATTSLGDLPNVYLLGQRDYSSLPGYLQTFSVATIPFKLSEAIQAVSPIKLFEYMAGGKPVVTSDMAECRKYPEVLIARSPDEWVSQLRHAIALHDDEEYLARVRLRGLQNTWEARAQTILDALHPASDPASDAGTVGAENDKTVEQRAAYTPVQSQSSSAHVAEG